MPITERASREERVPGSLSESRIRARTFACVSISVLAHMSLLIGMILAPQKFKEIAGGNQKPEGAGIAMLDGANTVGVAQADKTANTDTVEVAVAPQATLTDSSSDVVIKELPRTEPLVAVKPVVSEEKPVQKAVTKKAVTPSIAKPVAKAAKPAVQTAKIVEEPIAAPVENAQADVMTDESQEAPPVLLATPPSDDNSSDEKEVPAQAAAAEQEQPVAIAPTPIQEQEEAKAEQVQPMAVAPTPESNSETSAETAATAQSASAGRQEAQQQARSESPAPIAGRGGSGSTEENSAGAGGRENNAGLGPAIGEPVRNASELKVLPGNAQPAYPQRDRLARKQGTSVLVGKVTSDGRLVNTKVERSSGSALMDSASLQAFRSWRFQAGQEGWVRQPFQFKLVGEAREIPARLGQNPKSNSVR